MIYLNIFVSKVLFSSCKDYFEQDILYISKISHFSGSKTNVNFLRKIEPGECYNIDVDIILYLHHPWSLPAYPDMFY